jgi:hypothetical protein
MRAASPIQFQYLNQFFELIATVRVSFPLAASRSWFSRLRRWPNWRKLIAADRPDPGTDFARLPVDAIAH